VKRLAIRVRAQDAEIAFARLEPVLAQGAEEVAVGDQVEFAVYGDELPSEASVRSLGGDVVTAVSVQPVADGWERAWHEHLGRVVAGGVAVRPPWVEGRDDDLLIDPGLSFGVAAHPTTRLCLELLASSPRTALADWGCGSGVLAIAGARMGFSPVVAVELDEAAAYVARQNVAANGVDVDVRVGDVTRDAPWAPTVVANLTLPLLGSLALERAPDRLIASGFLAGQRVELGMAEAERRELDGWAAVVLERA
jgi:ribosomal protein L11 methyltransferase